MVSNDCCEIIKLWLTAIKLSLPAVIAVLASFMPLHSAALDRNWTWKIKSRSAKVQRPDLRYEIVHRPGRHGLPGNLGFQVINRCPQAGVAGALR